MTGRERMQRAMARDPDRLPDRVPVMCQLAIGHYLLQTGHDPAELWHRSEIFGDALVTLARRYRFDGILVNLPGRRPDWDADVASIEPLAGGGRRVHWRDGSRSDCPPDDNPVVYRPDPRSGELVRGDRLRPGIDEIDTESLCYLDPHVLPGERDRPLPEWRWRTLDIVLAEAGGALSVHGEFFSPFTQWMELLGYEPALTALMERPDRAEEILAALADRTAEHVLEMAARGVHAILQSSAFAGAGFLSRDQYSRFVLPFEREVVRGLRAKQPGLPVYTHTCGAIGDRLDLMLETGIDGIDTLDPPPLGTVELAEAKARFGDRCFFKGNLDGVNELLLADMETVRRAAQRRLLCGATNGGYVLSTACSVPPAVSADKLSVLSEVAESFGHYRPDGSLARAEELARDLPAARKVGPAPRQGVETAPGTPPEPEELAGLAQAVARGDAGAVVEGVRAAVDAGQAAGTVLDRALIAAMGRVGEAFSRGELFVPEMLLAARAMKAGLGELRPHLVAEGVEPVADLVLGTVRGDIHDIGKNLVAMMLEGAGFRVHDLGTDVPPQRFAAKLQQTGARILGLSALLTTTMPAMGAVVEELERAGLRERSFVLVGGAPLSEEFATRIRADAYGRDAVHGVELALAAARSMGLTRGP